MGNGVIVSTDFDCISNWGLGLIIVVQVVSHGAYRSCNQKAKNKQPAAEVAAGWSGGEDW